MLKVLFMGRKKVAALCLEKLLRTKMVQVVGVLTDSHLVISPTTRVAHENSLPILSFEAALSELKRGKLDFDLGLSMLYWRKLREEYLTIPEHGVINFHPAPLPEYKGVGGYNLAVLEGLSSWAVTSHYVDEQIDTGPIIHDVRFLIDPQNETALSLERMSQEMLLQLFDETLDLVLGNLKQVPTRPNGPGRYLTRTQLEQMKRIDLGTDDIAKKVRAFWFPPYDGAFIEHEGVKYTLVDRAILDSLADPNVSSLFSPTSSAKVVVSR